MNDEERNDSTEPRADERPGRAPAPGGEENSPEIDKVALQKLVYSVGYLWGILFFLPLILYKNNATATRHANECLVLLLFSVVGNAVFGILASFGGFMAVLFGSITGVYSLLLLVLGIIGIVYVCTDRNEPLPLIGSIHLLK